MMKSIYLSFPLRLFQRLLPLVLLVMLISLGYSSTAAAADPCAVNASTAPICTNAAFFSTDPANPCSVTKRLGGILEDIIWKVWTATQNASEDLYQSIIGNADFNLITYTALSLFIIFYATAFMFGFIQATWKDALFRLIKIGVVFWIISPTGWDAFNDIVVNFFNNGTTQLINDFIRIAYPAAIVSDTDPGSPFTIFDASINTIFSPRMAVTVIACFTHPPYGPLIFGAMTIAIIQFVKAMLKALLVYSLSIIAKALLFGIAPIFFIFMLFDKTKLFFQGWINQLVNFSLQPILMFAFLAFFAVMINTSATAILAPVGTYACYVKNSKQGTSPLDLSNWQFECPDGAGGVTSYTGGSDVNGMIGCPHGDIFPISIVNILIFLLITTIAANMVELITTLAAELSQGGVTKLDQVSGTLGQFFGNGGGRGGMEGADPRYNAPVSSPAQSR